MSDKCGGPAKCTNKGCNPEKKPEVCSGSAGFFSKLFGGGGETSADPCGSSGKCQDCGMDKCNCNCALREHLKQCCGYGTLPKLIDNCDAVNPPKKVDECGAVKSTCNFQVPETKCGPAPVVDKCAPPPKAADKCASTCVAKDAGPKVFQCPPMPCTDTTGCIPTWLCPPQKSGVPNYPAPAGVKIQPISVGGRKHQGYYDPSGKCNTCGTATKGPAPNVRSDCPMVKPRCGGSALEAKVGIFERIKSFFGFGKKS